MRLTEDDLIIIRTALSYVLGRMNCDWPNWVEEEKYHIAQEKEGNKSHPIIEFLFGGKEVEKLKVEYNKVCDKIEKELVRRP